MTQKTLNEKISHILGKHVEIKNVNKVVDLKPMYGSLFRLHIENNYEYWGWSDIDMLYGDVCSFLDRRPGYDIYSFGNSTFGPITIFSIDKYIDVYKCIQDYEIILNNPYTCKIDEMWFFDQFEDPHHADLYYDIKKEIFYDERCKEFIKLVENKSFTKLHVFEWHEKDTGIQWEVGTMILKNEEILDWNYEMKDGKLFLQGCEMAFSHLTLLKTQKHILEFIKKDNCKNLKSFKISFKINDSVKFSVEELESLDVYEIYEKYLIISVAPISIIEKMQN